MLELRNIVKVYPSGGENIRALKGIDLKFRNNEFVSILGPSGCGKTTMLNIIGGLDHYTEGDLLINGRSTKEYKDRDWDTYRNHSVGFVFQSYNLIPHQTVLSNVELALTLSGVSKRERKERAKKALEAVGLGTQLKKRPAQMSGGQMQRVAIARAIVNDPDIILADEPTGALDSETSIQVMNILKEIAGDRLVVMVTHNPELAYQYSTRIIRMLDGTVLDDSMPIGEDEMEQLRREDAAILEAGSRKAALEAAAKEAAEQTSGETAGQTAAVIGTAAAGKAAARAAKKAKKRRERKASMSLLTSFGLSLNNLFTKKGRTLLTAFAGSIGIIGIALIYAVSQGTSNYIDTVQENTLASYPLTITTEAMDFSAMLSSFTSSAAAAEENGEENTVVEQAMIRSMMEGVGTNDLKSFKQYLDENADSLGEDVTSIAYTYGITPLIYTRDVNGDLLQANPSRLSSMSAMSSMSSFGYSLFSEILADTDRLDEQYELLAGEWPDAYDEMVLVLNDPGKITDFLTYAIGLHDPNELNDMLSAIMSGETPDVSDQETLKWTYDDLLNLDLRLVLPSDCYRRDDEHNVWESMTDDTDYMETVYDGSLKLKVTAIATARNSDASLLSSGFNYLPELPLYIMDRAADSEIVKMQLADESVNVFSGKPFGEEDSDSGLDFADMIEVDEDAFASAFQVNFSADSIRPMLSSYLSNVASSLTDNSSEAAQDYSESFSTLASGMLNSLVEGQGGSAEVSLSDTDSIAENYLATEEAQQLLHSLAEQYGADEAQLTSVTKASLSAMLAQYVADNAFDTVEDDSGTAEEEDSSGTQAAETGDASAETEPPEVQPSGDEEETGEDSGSDQETLPSADVEELVDEVVGKTVTITAADTGAIVSGYTESALGSSASGAVGAMLIAPSLRNTLSSSVSSFVTQLMSGVMGSMSIDPDAIANAFQFNMTEDDMTRLLSALSDSSASSAGDNLSALGYAEREEPAAIYVYLKNFEAKDHFKTFVEEYNDAAEAAGEDDRVIRYTDITGVLMSSVTTIVDAVTYVLIAFVSISLIVSSIMIGVITLISVQERTKEIGVLRAIGASKRNVSTLFNAETVIIGFASGLIGVGITWLLCIPVNLILHKLTGISYLNAVLPVGTALCLIGISVLMTLIAGIIPSRSAAKKDPVVALRSE